MARSPSLPASTSSSAERARAESTAASDVAAEQQILRNYFEDVLYVLRRHERGLDERALGRVGLSRQDMLASSPALSFDASATGETWNA